VRAGFRLTICIDKAFDLDQFFQCQTLSFIERQKPGDGVAVKPLSSTLKVLQVLDVIASAPTPLRLTQIARALGEARGAVHQRLVTLATAGWVEQTGDGAYRLTLRIVAQGAMAMEQASLGERLATALEDLVATSGETSSIAVLDGAEAVIVRRVESGGMLRADLRVGTRLPLDRTAFGRVLVAHAPAGTVSRLRAAGVPLPAPEVIERVRAEGIAISEGPGPRALSAVAAPIFDLAGNCLCALAASGPYAGFDAARCAAAVRTVASRINARLQGAP